MLTQALVISLVVLFLHATTWDGMIFAGVKRVIKPKGWLYKPVYGCPICMAIWYGTVIYWAYFNPQHTGHYLDTWLLTIFMAGGFSVLFVLLIDTKDALIEINNKWKTK